MLRGKVSALRSRRESDVAVLQSELYDDVETRSRADSRPWQPIPSGSPSSPYAIREVSNDVAVFSAVSLADDELLGEALLWGIDVHNRSTHIGISLRPAVRGKGYGLDIVRVLCRYAFITRGLHRVQLETLADNAAMVAVAERAGFTHEGTARKAAWASGAFLDEVIYGLLADEF
jgi:RimJ/RimL family protein N-acetyltransferase